MQIASILTSKAGWLSIATGLSFVLTSVLPLIPAPWGQLVTAVLFVFSYYHIGNAVKAAHEAGIKGI
jgi:hypothetical protein